MENHSFKNSSRMHYKSSKKITFSSFATKFISEPQVLKSCQKYRNTGKYLQNNLLYAESIDIIGFQLYAKLSMLFSHLLQIICCLLFLNFFRCRVDFEQQPTFIQTVFLRVIGKYILSKIADRVSSLLYFLICSAFKNLCLIKDDIDLKQVEPPQTRQKEKVKFM